MLVEPRRPPSQDRLRSSAPPVWIRNRSRRRIQRLAAYR